MAERLTDEQIIDLVCCYSNYKETSETGVECEVISHQRIVEFVRCVEEPLLLQIAALRMTENFPLKEKRQWFLGEKFKRDGYFNRSDLINAFGISVPQASADIKRFLADYPSQIAYNPSSKRYERIVYAADLYGSDLYEDRRNF